MRPGGGPPSLHAHDPAELVAVQEGTITAPRSAPDGPPSPALVERVLALAEEHGMTMFPTG